MSSPATASVVTEMSVAAAPAQVWQALMFYEQISRRPPIHLRLLLPSPLRVEGRRSAVGDETRCVYEQGFLLKRATRIDPERHYGFEVVEQELKIGSGIRLSGGGYTLTERPDGSTRLSLETRYASAVRPRWLWRRIEAVVCHAFHRHILGAMRREVESLGSASVQPTSSATNRLPLSSAPSSSSVASTRIVPVSKDASAQP